MRNGSSVPDRMRAAFIDACGPADTIQCGQLPVPTLGTSDVLIRVAAVAVNPVDTFVRSGVYRTSIPFPFVIGRDLVGTVAAVGSGISDFTIGERVWCNSLGHAGRQGAAAEYAAVPAPRLYRLPDEVAADTAVAAVHPSATAHLALDTHAGLRAGETVYIAGGAGHVGRAAVQLAARAGARVVVSASAEDLEHCRNLGAETALDYRAENFAEQLRQAVPNGVDVHMNTSAQHDMQLATEILAERGRIIVMSGIHAHAELPTGPLYTRDERIIGFAISNARSAELADAATRINQLFTEGALAPREVEVLPLTDAAKAHQRVESGRLRGTRLVLRPGTVNTGY